MGDGRTEAQQGSGVICLCLQCLQRLWFVLVHECGLIDDEHEGEDEDDQEGKTAPGRQGGGGVGIAAEETTTVLSWM